MMSHLRKLSIFGVASLVCLALSSFASAGTISYIGKTTDITDFTGLGQEGYWFAQFAAPSPITNAGVNDNSANALPAWIVPDFDPASDGYSFGELAFSAGGNPSWNTFTLPDGSTGLSGSIIDPETDNNSNNTIPELLFGAGVPTSFLFHVVVDNTNKAHDSADRIRARGEDGVTGDDTDARVNTSPSDFNGIADIYTFRYDGWNAGDFIKMQLNSGVASVSAGFGGLMFDKIPEPTSATLCLLALAAVCGARRRA